jgi:hypothetical protein
MAIWWVARNGGPGTPISWAGQYRQEGYADEALDDADSSELSAFLSGTKPTVITPAAFLARFTDAERAAVRQAALDNAEIALGLTEGFAHGPIDLHNPLILPWMQELVTAGCLTQDRMTQIMTP